ncbi:MAG: 5-(carboxyamino)imidazole ribonucleotide synthase [Steroidobacteraceae bacterium]
MKIGIIGAGQLGRMLALSGYPLGQEFLFLDPSPDAPGGHVGPLLRGEFDDAASLKELADKVDLITFDVENVPVDAIREIAKNTPFLPQPDALGTSQDRLAEKMLFRSLKIPTPEFHAVDSLADLVNAVDRIGLPGILKTRRLGYDGRGQFRLRSAADIEAAWAALGSVPLIYEAFVHFNREVSVIGVRSTRGEVQVYPLAANTHVDGILRHSVAPYRNAALQKQAETYLKRVFKRFDYAGILTIEFFVAKGRLIANEMAPRVHNSGHWTIEGAATSQFENHIRAIMGLPLGSTAAIGHSGMVNFIGTIPEVEAVLAIPGAHFHGYGKAPRPNRKVGHCTVTATTPAARDKAVARVLKLL